jgi:hypothetical protein
MIERLFLDGIDVARDQFPENQRVQNARTILAHTANAAAALFDEAPVPAEVALDFAVAQGLK